MLNNRVGLIEPRLNRAARQPSRCVGRGKSRRMIDPMPPPRKGGTGSHPHHNYTLSALNPRYFPSPLAMRSEFPLPERSRSLVSLNCSTDKSLFPRA